MSEQPTTGKVTTLDDYREGSPFDENTDVALKMSSLPYDPDEIARIHQIEAARRAREAAIAAERDMVKSGPELAGEDLARLTAVRNAALNGQIGIAA